LPYRQTGLRDDQKSKLLGKSPSRPSAPVCGNTGKLQQVFLNLFINARNAMPAARASRLSRPVSLTQLEVTLYRSNAAP
jgi:signal transduction histidine kinase